MFFLFFFLKNDLQFIDTDDLLAVRDVDAENLQLAAEIMVTV